MSRWSWGCVAFGVGSTQGRMRRLVQRSERGFERGLRKWLNMVGALSQGEVPRITGHLARSMRITTSRRPAGGMIKYIAPYAAIVHEVPRPSSSNGKWKFLEDPMKAMAPRLERVVATEVRAEVGR